MFEDFELSIPDAAALIESMRSFGYGTDTALADLIDNSVSARAGNVWIDAFWDGPASYIRVCDDGLGMSEAELVSAMRLGSRSPREERDAGDLGRFGLGLKSASFAQCRNLTVASRSPEHPIAIRRWDLDYVQSTREWRLLHNPDPSSIVLLEPLKAMNHGTIVLWQRMDRVVGDPPADDERARRRFLQLVSDVETHVAMIFHRVMRPRGLRIHINQNLVAPWDPFVLDSPATQQLGEEVLLFGGAAIRIFPFVVPHHSKIDEGTRRSAAGPKGWNAHQGFYVYRGKRLIVPGSWLGLGLKQEEHFKLARIQVDIPNSMDEAWQIDIRKSQAHPPGPLREEFRRIATFTRTAASDVYRHRGKRVTAMWGRSDYLPWLRLQKHGKVFYRVNREHPLVREALKLPLPDRERFLAVLTLLEETLPIPMITIDNAEHPEQQPDPLEGAEPDAIHRLLREFYQIVRGQGRSHEETIRQLLLTEPFARVPEMVMAIEFQHLEGHEYERG